MEKWLFKIFDKIELVNEKLFYLVAPYTTKIINHVKENTLGSIMLIVVIIVIFRIINKLFKKKYGYSMININCLIFSPTGALIYGGKYWLEYAIKNNKVKWYPIGFILFFLFSITYIFICIIIKIIKERKVSDLLGFLLSIICFLILYGTAKDLVTLFIFFIAIGALGEVEEKNRNTYIIEQRNNTVGPNF